MTATAAPDAAYTPDIASALEACFCMWPPKHALMTEHAETSDVNHKFSAATPVPFRATPVNRSSTPGAAPLPQRPLQPVMATVCVPGDKLTITDLAALQKLPAFEVSFQVSMATLMGALKRTDLLPEEGGNPSTSVSAHTPVAAVTKAEACLKAKMADPNPRSSTKESHGKSESATSPAQHAVCTVDNAKDKFDASEYASQTAGLYCLKEGVTLVHRGHTRHPARILFDTCSETNLLSKKFADENGILYGPTPTQIHTSIGTSSGVIGKVVGPIHTVLNQGTPHECKTFTTESVQFLVTQGVDHLYDVLLSTHVARDWGARADPVCNVLEYRPHLMSGDAHTIASVPLTSTGKNQVPCASASAVVCASTQEDVPADAPQAPKTDPFAAQESACKTNHPASARATPLNMQNIKSCFQDFCHTGKGFIPTTFLPQVFKEKG